MRLFNLLPASLLLLLSACAEPTSSESTQPDLASEEQALRDLNTRWLSASQANDAAAEAAFFAADGVAYREGVDPIIGPAAYQASKSQFLAENPQATVTWSTDTIQIAESADLAVQTGEVRAAGLASLSEAEVIRRRYVVVWKKVDGAWKIAYDIGSTLPASSSR
jgi:uncharacterized protein (TIGR02246 family)